MGNGKELMMDRVHNWYSVRLQIESIQALLPYDFTWVLPGHGYMHHFNTVEEKNVALRKLIEKESM
jgi:glyoxylase-like metal-dependent hydrolase (beta-lactamase superfamily II)